MRILGIETSCDETAAAILQENRVIANVIASQQVHTLFGGVVPELASRAHLRKIIPVVDAALSEAQLSFSDLDAVAVTCGPGLIGSLLVGVQYAKGVAMARRIPLIGVNHLEGHIYSNFISHPHLQPPLLILLVSGGHTMLILMKDHLEYQLLGQTRDDAVGEAYDKVAKMLQLGYPGGPVIDRYAQEGDASYVQFPKGLAHSEDFDFSYSGLKTAVLQFLREKKEEEWKKHLSDICASFQKAAIDILVEKTIRAARTYQIRHIAVAGGVAANSYLRRKMKEEAREFHLEVYVPELKYCMDNAAMIARAGLERWKRGFRSDLTLNAYPTLPLDQRMPIYD